MRISLNWLNDYVNIKKEDVKELAKKITKAGVNVETINKVDLNHLVVGEVLECLNHPNAKRLKVCQVNLGDEVVQIVCGADNVAKEQKVIVAKVGAFLPPDIKIEKVNIRGIESKGMICALYELGIEDKESNYDKGIHVLPSEAKVGSEALIWLGLDDVVYQLDLDPNRNDCLSHLGFAYEVGAVLNKEVKKPLFNLKPISKSIKDWLTLTVATEKCPMYQARIVEDIEIKESPSFIKQRLISVGMRPINNIVDISNYVMLEYGQPLHFFDQAKVGSKIEVRMAKEGESTITIDQKKVSLTSDDLVITDGKQIIAIAGVMGSLNSEINPKTKNILIESALFDPLSVRYTSLRLDLRSEAALRFEKGLNDDYTSQAIDRACYLLAKYAKGKVLSDTLIHNQVVKTSKLARVSRTKINDVLGTNLNNDEIMGIFKRLKFNFTVKGEEFTVTIPKRRMDVSISQDLIEEVGRLYGYDNIVAKPLEGPINKGSYNFKTLFLKDMETRLQALGLNQVLTYTLIGKDDDLDINYQKKEEIKLLKPMTEDKSILRQSLIPSLLKVVDYNYGRGLKDIFIYEISNVYGQKNNQFIEDTKLGIVMMGAYLENTWQKSKITTDFYLIKGIVENILSYLGFTNRYSFKRALLPSLIHPGISAEVLIDNEPLGFIGAIHPSFSKLPIFIGELNLSELLAKKVAKLKFNEVSKYPSITKDLAFLIDDNLEIDKITNLIYKVGGKLLIKIDVFDVYQGNNIASTKKSVAFSLTFNDKTKTLTDEQVNHLLTKIISNVELKLGGQLRSL